MPIAQYGNPREFVTGRDGLRRDAIGCDTTLRQLKYGRGDTQSLKVMGRTQSPKPGFLTVQGFACRRIRKHHQLRLGQRHTQGICVALHDRGQTESL